MNSQTALTIAPLNYDIFAGLDVDKTSISVTFASHTEKPRSIRIPYDADHLLNYVRNHFSEQRVAFAYEAGPTGYGLHDDLVAQGHPCLVVAPSMVPTAPGLRVKTNRLDSVKLAEGLRGGQLKSIHVPSAPYRQLRHLVQLRDTSVRQATATKCRIKALLLFEGIPFPESAGGDWTRSALTRLKGLPCEGAVRFKLDSLLRSLQFAQEQALDATKEIRRFCAKDAELERCTGFLTSIPGIGTTTATALLARIGDWRQLRNVRQIAGLLGLAPTEHSTGDDVNKGSITRAGDTRARNKLIQAAWAAIRRDPEMDEFYHRVYQKHPKDRAAKKAIVAVARKMTTRIYAVLHEQRPYEIRHVHSSVHVTQEETALSQGTPRRYAESGKCITPADSKSETETPGPTAPHGLPLQTERESGGFAPRGTHLNPVRRPPSRATDSSKSSLGTEEARPSGAEVRLTAARTNGAALKKSRRRSVVPCADADIRRLETPCSGDELPAGSNCLRGELPRVLRSGAAKPDSARGQLSPAGVSGIAPGKSRGHGR